MNVILLDELRDYEVRYAALPMQPLKITCELLAPVAHYHNVHFDGILSYAAMEEATQGRMVAQSSDYYTVPLPIKTVWHSGLGVPLHAVTDMQPHSSNVQDVIYYHRRALEPTMTKKTIRTTQGRHKEKRTPIPASVTSALVCYAYGNMEEIGRLLQPMAAVGKKHNTLGTVKRWLITPVEYFSFVDKEHHARCPLPLAALYGDDKMPFDMIMECKHLGFTSPYWHWMSKSTCVDTGRYVSKEHLSLDLVLR